MNDSHVTQYLPCLIHILPAYAQLSMTHPLAIASSVSSSAAVTLDNQLMNYKLHIVWAIRVGDVNAVLEAIGVSW